MASWDNYLDSRNAVERRAAYNLTHILQNLDFVSMSEAEITATVNRIYGQIYEVFGDASEMVAREWLDAVAEKQAAHMQRVKPLEPQPDAQELAQKMERRAQRTRSATSDFAATLHDRGKDAAIEEAAARIAADVKADGNDALLEDGRTRGYEFAWVPRGDTCAFCIALAANGWTATKKDIDSFKQHVHTHCDCELAARPIGSSQNPPGYDPDYYAHIYESANGGKGSSTDKINAIRRAQYAEDGDRIRQQHRDAYSRRMNKRDGVMNVEVDETVPCLRRMSDGKIVETQVIKVGREELKNYRESNGWYIDWSATPSDVAVYKITVEGENEAQGLIGVRDDKDNMAVYVHWGVAAPWNQGLIVGTDNKRYNGVGGHIFAVAASESVKLGYGGFFHAKAANGSLLAYYIKEFGAKPTGNGYGFYVDEASAQKLLEEYTWTS